VEAAKAMGVKLPEKELRQVGPEGEERITVTLDQETVELLSKFKSLTAHKNPMAGTSEAIKLALQFAVEKMNPIESAQRFSGKIKQCETSRGISKSMRTQVFERDRGVCQYKDSKTGRKCESDFKIEVDHVVAWSRGGKSTLENLQCLCANHNQWKSCN
jgi:hypothetical protein